MGKRERRVFTEDLKREAVRLTETGEQGEGPSRTTALRSGYFRSPGICDAAPSRPSMSIQAWLSVIARPSSFGASIASSSACSTMRTSRPDPASEQAKLSPARPPPKSRCRKKPPWRRSFPSKPGGTISGLPVARTYCGQATKRGLFAAAFPAAPVEGGAAGARRRPLEPFAESVRA